MEVHGFGEGTPFASKGFLNTIVDFDMLMCEGRGDNSIYNFEGDRVFRGVPTEVNAVVLKEVPVLHALLRFAFFLLSLLGQRQQTGMMLLGMVFASMNVSGATPIEAELDVVGKAVQVLRLDGEAGGAEASE